jgi:hypothetical protein
MYVRRASMSGRVIQLFVCCAEREYPSWRGTDRPLVALRLESGTAWELPTEQPVSSAKAAAALSD